MAKLWIMSDLHLETVPYPEAFKPVRPDFDVLVAAGDIWEGNVLLGFQLLLRIAGGKPVVFAMGNHEHWDGILSEDLRTAKAVARKHRVTLLDGNAATIAGCRFVGATLWSDYSLAGDVDPRSETGEKIDIVHDGQRRRITVADVCKLHSQAHDQLWSLTAEASPLPVVVVTHHAPHPDCVPPAHCNSWAAGNSASDLTALIDSGRVTLWVHGHLHHSIDMVRPNGTRILCNPAGPWFSNTAFSESLVVELPT